MQAGLTPIEALEAAIRNPAQYLGIPASSGTVDTGQRADLVLLNANPLDDIRNTRNMSAAVLKGGLIDSKERAATLQQVEAQWKAR